MKFNLLKQLMFACVFLYAGFSYAQTVNGTVTGDDGPLPGVNVIVKGTTNGVSTDFDGNYTIENVSSDAVLEFSSLGFTTQEIAVNGQSTINVVLATDAQALDEVIIIGYGTTTVKDATGAVASVSSDDFNGGAIASAEQLIQGKVAGVQTVSSSGEPGAGIALRIRGTTSVTSNNDPLYVVDGVPLSGDDTSASGQDTGFGTGPASNPLSFLNPNDIESMSVLKDASATAIYGSRGANGVVIITTKSGKGRQGGVFEFNSSVSFSSPANSYDLLNAADYLDAIEDTGGNRDAQDFGSDTDWQDVVTRSSVSNDQSLAYSYNHDSGSVRATFGYQDLQGVIENSGLQRISGRINAFQRLLDDRLNLSFQGTYSTVDEQQPPLSGSAGFAGDLLGATYSANPTWPNDPDFDEIGAQRNPANMLKYIDSNTETDRFLMNFSADYAFLPELVGKITLGYDTSTSSRHSETSPNALATGDNVFGNGLGSVNDLDTESKLMEITLTWDKDWDNSRLNLLGGYSYQDFKRSGRNLQGKFYNTDNMSQMAKDLRSSAAAIEALITGSYQQYGVGPNNSYVNRLFPEVVSEPLVGFADTSVGSVVGDTFDFTDELQSFFTRANYTLMEKYLFTATLRVDGSSKFGGNNKYGVFPSAAFAWKINEEDFIGDKISTLKARLSWGITGNQDGLGHGNYIQRDRFAAPGIENNGNVNAPGTETVSFANPDLKWEETTSYGFGVDFGLNDNRLTTSFDIYRKETKDLLLKVRNAQPTPQPTSFINLDGVVVNEGIEWSIDYDFFQTDDFTWNAGFNISYNSNEIQNFPGQIEAGTIRGQGLTGAFSQILAGDQPLFSYYLRDFQGFDENGQPIGDTQGFVGKSALATTNAGLNTTLTYKRWDLNLFFAGQWGGYVYNNTQNAFFTAGTLAGGRNVTYDVLTSGEATDAEASVSTRFLYKADFIRLQNASLGYTFGLSEQSKIRNLRLYLTGQNLFLITDYNGLDPEVSTTATGDDVLNGIPTAGIDYTSYPRPRVVTLGLNLSF